MPGPSTVILVRHAEPQTSGADPGLTAAGRKRAELLGFMSVTFPLDRAAGALYKTPSVSVR